MICGKTFLYLKKHIGSRWFFAFLPARCKSWSCPTCRLIKSRIVSQYVRDNFAGEDNYMLTLTFFHSGDLLEAWQKIGECWNRARTYIAKKYGKFDYLRCIEPHADGMWPHMHVLIKGCKIDSEIVKLVVQWGFGWNLHHERISGVDAANYLSKYLSKEWPVGNADLMRIQSKTRIVSVSRGMPALFATESTWEVVKHDIPPDHCLFLCNYLIHLLKESQCQYVLARPLSDGFIIESDIPIYDSLLEENFPPGTWKYCEDSDYSYLPYGLQQELGL
jgi:hypothetical protein